MVTMDYNKQKKAFLEEIENVDLYIEQINAEIEKHEKDYNEYKALYERKMTGLLEALEVANKNKQALELIVMSIDECGSISIPDTKEIIPEKKDEKQKLVPQFPTPRVGKYDRHGNRVEMFLTQKAAGKAIGKSNAYIGYWMKKDKEHQMRHFNGYYYEWVA